MVILALGAHPDDIELNCGGTLTRFGEEHTIVYTVFSDCVEQPGNEGIAEELLRAVSLLDINEDDFYFEHFPNTRFPEHAPEIRRVMEKLRDKYDPYIVLTASSDDVHQDHRTLYEETLRVFRNTTILGTESLRSSMHFKPNCFVRLSNEHVNKKIEVLKCYRSQFGRYYFSETAITSLMIHRGKQIGAEFAEAYEVIRVVV